MLSPVIRPLRIGIVGAGVAGCTAGIMLARQGHAVSLFEQSPRVGPVGAGVLLQPSGQGVLQRLGLLEQVIANAERIDRLVAYTHRGRLLSNLSYGDHSPDAVAYGLHRGDLFGVIHNAMIASGVRAELNHTVEDLAPLASRFDLLVAADGSRSRLRAQSGLRFVEHHYAPAALWAVGRCDTVRNQLLQKTRDTRELCGLLPMGNGRCSFFWGVDKDDLPSVQRQPFERWRQQVLALMPEAKALLEPLRGFQDLMFASYRAIWMPRVHRRNVVFIGDAAHSASPHLGQGINLAMLDARDLAASIQNTRCVDEALERYHLRQFWRNAYYSVATACLTPTFQGRLTPLGHARDIGLPLLQRCLPSRKLMLMTLTGSPVCLHRRG